MPRWLLVLVLAVLALVAAGGGLWYAAYGMADAPPAEDAVAGLRAPVTVRWAEHAAAVEATGDLDALAGLGYVHGARHAWTAALWRQTALGHLSAWFGAGTLPLDRHARALGWAHAARTAYAALPEAEQRRLEAYVGGLNAALAARTTQRQDAFVLLGLTPEPWAPWHPLAVERLLAWLATPPLPLDAANPPDAARTFARRDALLRRWLHLGGFERGLAYALRDTTRADAGGRRVLLGQRMAYGASALPFTAPVVMEGRTGQPRQALVTVPGTLVWPAGAVRGADGSGRAWAVFVQSTVRLDTVRLARYPTRPVRHERMRVAGVGEALEPVRRTPGGALPLGALAPTPRTDALRADSLRLARRLRATPAADSLRRDSLRAALARTAELLPDATRVLALAWPGLATTSGATDWHALRLGPARLGPERDSLRPAAFAPWSGHGLVTTTTGGAMGDTVRVLGSPRVTEALPGDGVLVSPSPWARWPAAQLRSVLDDTVSANAPRRLRPDVWHRRDTSTWADTLRAAWLPDLAPLAGHHATLDRALDYLRNWNGAYERASIGASLFDAWMRRVRQHTGRRPPDTTRADYFGAYRRRQAFAEAVAGLRARYGVDLRQWRWERVAPDRRAFPVWSADSLVRQHLAALAASTFAPLELPGQGHPSTLGGGPALVEAGPPAPAHVEAWTAPSGGLVLMRQPPGENSFLGRFTRPDRRRTPMPLAVPPDAPATRLRPAS